MTLNRIECNYEHKECTCGLLNPFSHLYLFQKLNLKNKKNIRIPVICVCLNFQFLDSDWSDSGHWDGVANTDAARNPAWPSNMFMLTFLLTAHTWTHLHNHP